jgi:hypothetical protein
MGCIGQVGPDAYNARRVALAAGLDRRVPAYTVNRLCGSGLQAIWNAAMQIRWGGVEMVVAGGNESMTRMPFYDFGARSGYRLGDRTLVDGTQTGREPAPDGHPARRRAAVRRPHPPPTPASTPTVPTFSLRDPSAGRARRSILETRNHVLQADEFSDLLGDVF